MSARISLIISSFCLLFSWVAPSQAQTSYRVYRNARFGTLVQFPANLVEPQPESANGDGRKFVSRDGQIELTVYASHAIGRQLRAEMSRAVSDWRRDGARLTYQKTGPGWFALSGFIGDDIFYEKTLLRGEVLHSLIWQYPQNLRRRLDEPVTRSVRTFTAVNSVIAALDAPQTAAVNVPRPTAVSRPRPAKRRPRPSASNAPKTAAARGY